MCGRTGGRAQTEKTRRQSALRRVLYILCLTETHLRQLGRIAKRSALGQFLCLLNPLLAGDAVRE